MVGVNAVAINFNVKKGMCEIFGLEGREVPKCVICVLNFSATRHL